MPALESSSVRKVAFEGHAMAVPSGLGGQSRQRTAIFQLDCLTGCGGALQHLLHHEEIHGPVNMVAPQETTNAQFTSAMRHALIPAFLPTHYWTPPAPALAIELLLGDMGRELLLASQRVRPVRLEETGYSFAYPTIQQALDALV